MKKLRRIPTFLAGAVVALILCTSVTTALAASGTISFNQIQVNLDGKTIIYSGEDMTLPSGAKVPSSILYTDATGGGTTYLPVRKLSEAAGTPFLWSGEQKLVSMHAGCLAEIMKLPLNCGGIDGLGAVFEKSMNEVLPVISDAAPNLLAPVNHKEQAAFKTDIPVDEAKGKLISVTVTNHGDNPVEFQLGTEKNQSLVYTASMIPAHSTVTRTMQLSEGAKENIKNLYTFVGYPECPYQDCKDYIVDVTVEAVQFTK